MAVRLCVRSIVCAAAVFAAGGCRLARDLLPRTHTVAASPDRQYVASVYQGLNPDPPDDHLYLSTAGRRAQRLMSLAPDAESCRSIVWSADSRSVGFLINDQRLAVFDAGPDLSRQMLVLPPPDLD